MGNAYVATNFATTTLAADITTAIQTALTLTDGAKFPSPTGGDYTLVALAKPDGTRELCCIVGRSGNGITVGIPGSDAANAAGRGYEGTTATTFVSGNAASCVPSAALMVAALAHVADPTAAHAATAVAFTPAGGIAATEVQAALEEVDADKFAKTGGAISGSVTGASFIDSAKASVASHATTAPIWAAAGNLIDYTGVAVATAFPAAAQAGAERVLICAGACGFTAGANMLIEGVASGATFTAAANDEITVRAISTTQFRLSIKKYDGYPVVVVQGVKPGTIIDFGGSAAPSGYLACNGASYLRASYADLFTAIGTLWGAADGTHFNVPNFAAGDASIQTAGTVGASSDGQMPQHAHGVNGALSSTAPLSIANPGAGSTFGQNGFSSANAGSGTRNFAAGKHVLKCIKT